VIGAGRVGRVYAARDLNGRRDVAFKIIPERSFKPPATPEALMSALATAIKLNSPRLVRSLAFGRWGRGVYLVFELAKQPTLRQLLDESSSLPAKDRVRRLARPLETAIEAVAAAHGMDAVHGEACPRKFFVSEDGGSRLAGAGLCFWRFFSAKPLEPWYQAPRGLAGVAADAYALRRLCVEVLTGRRPNRIEDIPAEDIESLPRKARSVLTALLDASPAAALAGVPACRLAASKIIASF
ncbi:MAG TPA: protein kinase, partial [Candidatus Brocadiia bacterium]|nr:protein kinase [Candidatus Brocadiia bacterium]